MIQGDAQPAAATAAPSAPDPPPMSREQAAAGERAPTHSEPLVEEDLLVEDVSIDGMCGVY